MPIWEPVPVKKLRSCPRRSIVTFVVTVVVATCSAGCGPERPKTIPVRGTISFDGAPPPAPGAIYFAPIEVAEGYARRPGRARFDTDGLYRATSFEDGDGLVPGKYLVRVECWQTVPGPQGPGVSYVDPQFSPENLVVEVEQDRIELDVNVLRN